MHVLYSHIRVRWPVSFQALYSCCVLSYFVCAIMAAQLLALYHGIQSVKIEHKAIEFDARMRSRRPRIIQDKFRNTHITLAVFWRIRVISNFEHKVRLY
jgi:hypothetical protein